MKQVTLSLIKADIGGFPGHVGIHPNLIEIGERELMNAKKKGDIIDYRVMKVGDDLQLLFYHQHGNDSPLIHELAWQTFKKAAKEAHRLRLYGAGQDLLTNAFSGNVKGMGPGVAELTFSLRPSEPVVAFMMDKTEPGAFNLPLYRIFADPFNTAGLVIDPSLQGGFVFEVWDIMKHTSVRLKTPEESYQLLALIGAKSRYVIKHVYPGPDHPKLNPEIPVASVSTEKLSQIAGEYVGKDDPVALIRCQSGLPALGEVLEPFALPYLVSGWMRGSHNGPIMPVSFDDANCTRFDGPPRIVAAGFQITEDQLVGPADLFKDPAFDEARKEASKIATYLRRQGPFEPHRLPLQDMEYTTLPQILNHLKDRFTTL
ncbi:fructose 1,6-bisphosphatase [Anoxybacter fermentans]|uniref:Fructose-1,6-bisphosphate aldolase/phosphatase n=1 Tax=Anoxybacter fermentans TaxID=1323375 RepID=A0A3S9T1J8_9FIRM|nr:fructose-1,6-bisphosphate aldolase/phosphatase [Anoxybacter fermentans]AZR74486.1 fructose 1,6-bisphosphatase [Anoxybacter fermentans]